MNGQRSFKYLFDNGGVAGIGEGWQSGVDAKVVERCEYRVPVSFRGLFVDFGQGKQKSQHLFSGDASKITIAKLGCKTGEDELTGFDGIFFLELAR